ncbi:hypothetical protein FRC11_013019, partial [Ceratobasidium sp. 423]
MAANHALVHRVVETSRGLVSNAITYTKLLLDLLNDNMDPNLVDPNLTLDDTDVIPLTVEKSKIQQDHTFE